MSEAVRVVIRCRPFSKREKEAGHTNICAINKKDRRVTISAPPTAESSTGATGGGQANGTSEDKSFTFDAVFDETTPQVEVYNQTAKPIVDSVLEGFNGTVFAYGQTGSGKTFSMQGLMDPPELRGIIPQTFDHIFSRISQTTDRQYLVTVSYLEIYNEEIRDLLAKDVGGKRGLELKEHPDKGVYVKDLTKHQVTNAQDMDKIMETGNRIRSVGATLMNETSSRSHSIFTITIESCLKQPSSMIPQPADDKQHIVVGKLNLIDLAGSERQSKTGATGDRLKEGAKINLSLTALGNVISALVDGKSSHVPYRDSKLTRLLQDSLGGNSKTLMIATMSPASYNYDETMGTLRYANRAKNIKNKPVINEDPKDAQLRQYQEEIEKLRAMLFSKKVGKNGVLPSSASSTAPSSDGPTDSKRCSVTTAGGEDSLEAPRNISDLVQERLSKMQEDIDRERQQLVSSKGMAEEERRRIGDQLNQREDELRKEREMREQLAQKLKSLESKLIIGGVDLKDHVERQQRELAERKKLLDSQRAKQDQLRQEMERQQEAQLQLAGKFASLQEEVDVKTKKLNKLWSKLQEVKQEIAHIQDDYRDEKEEILSTIRELNKELSLKERIIDLLIPPQVREKLDRRVQFDQESGEWVPTLAKHPGTVERSLINPGIFKFPVSMYDRYRLSMHDNDLRYRHHYLLDIALFVPEHRVPDYDTRTAGAYLANNGGERIASDIEAQIKAQQQVEHQRRQLQSRQQQQPGEQFPQARNLVNERRRFA